ncbi:MAG: ChaB family protein [Actinomycetes bacterium]|jgi:cation transport regulator|nr:ChaB family protein [Actinomycetes bacterium]
MQYESTSELPKGVQHVLPQHAQDIYKEAFNHAFAEYADPGKRRGSESQEETAHRVAWAAVEGSYQREADGTWHRKGV